jgi:multidrug efflux system membrane fusion protein
MGRRRWAIAILLVAAGAAGLWRGLDRPTPARAAESPPAVPVTTAAAQVQDVPIYLDGLGTVQAFSTVEIKAQVNGTLIDLPAREGQEVHKGDIVAVIDPRPYQAALAQATAQRGEDEALLHSAELDLHRYQALAKSQFAPYQQVDDQQATAAKDAAAVAADEAAMQTAQINLGYCVIRAPIDGRIGLYQVDAGNLIEVASQTGILSITQDTPIAVVFTLPEADLLRVQAAQAKGPVPVQVVANDFATTLAVGTLMAPNNTIDTSTGTISLKARFDNRDDHVWPGEFVNTRVQVATASKAVTVPVPAVGHGPGGLYVYVVNADRTVKQVAVQKGYQDQGRVIITKGLSGGETVVVGGQSRLANGVHVQATAASQVAQPAAQAADGAASPS